MVLQAADGSKVIIVHPGSYFLRLGKPLDPFPQSLPHVVAVRRPKVVSPPAPDDILGIPEKQSVRVTVDCVLILSSYCPP